MFSFGWHHAVSKLKIFPAGSAIWVRKAQGSVNAYHPPTIAVDGEGNDFQSAAFDSSQFRSEFFGLTNQSSNTIGWPSEVCVAKYSGNGAFLWARTLSGSGEDNLDGLSVDRARHLYGTGRFKSGALQLGNVTMEPAMQFDLLLVKMDTTQLPSLSFARTPNSMILSWDSIFSGYQIESSSPPFAAAPWTTIKTIPSVGASNNLEEILLTNSHQYFRLVKP